MSQLRAHDPNSRRCSSLLASVGYPGQENVEVPWKYKKNGPCHRSVMDGDGQRHTRLSSFEVPIQLTCFLPFKMWFNYIIVIRWKEYLISGWGWSNDWALGPFGHLLSTSSNTRIYGSKSFFPTVTNVAWHYIFLKTRNIYLIWWGYSFLVNPS